MDDFTKWILIITFILITIMTFIVLVDSSDTAIQHVNKMIE